MSAGATTYRKKFYGLIAGFVAVSLLAYFLSVSKTLEQRALNRELTQKLAGIRSLGSDLGQWEAQNAALDEKLGKELEFSNFHESLLARVGVFCEENNITLTEFSEPFEGQDGSYSVETIILTLEGTYKPLLRLLHKLETEFTGGKVSSATFIKEKNYRKNREELFLKLYIQRIKKNEHEKS